MKEAGGAMFKTLLIKEWKEKALIAVFGLGVMVIFLAAFLIFGDNRDLRELVPLTFLIFFFPFIGVMLGAGAFESEFRNGSWAYLLSRPVRKETIWLAKLTALLAIMAGFWLVFIGLMAVVPGLGEVVRGFRFSGIFDVGVEVFPLILLSSVFYFSVAFSLSILSERQLSLVFGSFFIGFFVQALLSYFASPAEDRGLLSNVGRFAWLDAYDLALVLSGLAFLVASLITFRKADFSQPKKKNLSLAKYAILFLVLAWILAVAWPVFRPGPEEKFSSGVEVVGSEAFFSTTRGLYRFDIVRDHIKKIARWGPHSPQSSFVIAGGRVLYDAAGWNLQEGPALRIMNTDGSGKRLLVGSGSDGFPGYQWFSNFLLSPDGKTAVFAYEEIDETSPKAHNKAIASIRTDGTGLKKLPPLDPALAGTGGYSWIRAWLEPSNSLLLMGRSQRTPMPMGLWTYNLATGAQAKLFETPRAGSMTVSPGHDKVFILSQPEVGGPTDVTLLDIASAEFTPVLKVENPDGSNWFSVRRPVWNRKGDKVAFLVRQAGGVVTPAVYLLKERQVVMPKNYLAKEMFDFMPPAALEWMSEDAKLVLGSREERSLKILDPALAVEKAIPLPASIGEYFEVCSTDDTVLIWGAPGEVRRGAVWRLDLKTEKWKRIW
jgi:ABC-type transport system involved in multi-copper enzyme maturation permease subunit/Tol biopolymer transport system component